METRVNDVNVCECSQYIELESENSLNSNDCADQSFLWERRSSHSQASANFMRQQTIWNLRFSEYS